jgi:hypothetical protein
MERSSYELRGRLCWGWLTGRSVNVANPFALCSYVLAQPVSTPLHLLQAPCCNNPSKNSSERELKRHVRCTVPKSLWLPRR